MGRGGVRVIGEDDAPLGDRGPEVVLHAARELGEPERRVGDGRAEDRQQACKRRARGRRLAPQRGEDLRGPERNRYLVLSLDFSDVASDGGQEALRRTFLQSVRSRVLSFLLRYRERVPLLADLHERLHAFQDAEALLSDLMARVAATDHKLYVIIDEYDHFANRILSGGAQDLYASIVERTGFVRTFYAALKAGTGSGAIGRMFITGVTPLLLDDLSSGFNIATHASQDRALATLAGLTRADVEQAVDEFLAARPELASRPALADRERLLGVLEQYYDGYRFSPDAPERVFNSDMVLYFLSELDRKHGAPGDMLDLNVRADYRHLSRIGALAGAAAAERRALLEAILSDGGIRSEVIRQFGVRSLSSRTQFISLLYYLGMLTLGEQPEDQPPVASGYRLVIPNRATRDVQWKHLATLLMAQAKLSVDTSDLDRPCPPEQGKASPAKPARATRKRGARR